MKMIHRESSALMKANTTSDHLFRVMINVTDLHL